MEGEGLRKSGSCFLLPVDRRVSAVFFSHIISNSSSSFPSCLIFLGVCNGYRMLHRIAVPK